MNGKNLRQKHLFEMVFVFSRQIVAFQDGHVELSEAAADAARSEAMDGDDAGDDDNVVDADFEEVDK